MTVDGLVARLTIYLGAADRTGKRLAPEDVVRRAHAAGLTGERFRELLRWTATLTVRARSPCRTLPPSRSDPWY